MPTPSDPRKSKLPLALVKHAEKLAKQKHTRLHAEAEELVREIRQKQKAISDAFYDVGLALQRLKAREMQDGSLDAGRWARVGSSGWTRVGLSRLRARAPRTGPRGHEADLLEPPAVAMPAVYREFRPRKSIRQREDPPERPNMR